MASKWGRITTVHEACTADHWIDANDARVRQEPTDLVQWWTVFQDPVSITSSSVPAVKT